MAVKTIISSSYSSGVILSGSVYGSPLTVSGTINVSPGDAIFYQGGTGTNWTIANRRDGPLRRGIGAVYHDNSMPWSHTLKGDVCATPRR